MRRFAVAKLLHKTLDEIGAMTERELSLWSAYCEWEHEQIMADQKHDDPLGELERRQRGLNG